MAAEKTALSADWVELNHIILKSEMASGIAITRHSRRLDFRVDIGGQSSHHTFPNNGQVMWLAALFVANWQAVGGQFYDEEITKLAAKQLGVRWSEPKRARCSEVERINLALIATFGLEAADLANVSWMKLMNIVVRHSQVLPPPHELRQALQSA